MPTQQEIKESEARFAALPEKEQIEILNQQRERRIEAQSNVHKLQLHGDLLNALVGLNTDQAREYITQLGANGPGNVSDELAAEIFGYVETAQFAQLNDLGGLAAMLTAQQIGDAIKNDTEAFGAIALAEVLKRD